MNLDEMDRRDWNEVEPDPPVSEEHGRFLIRQVYKEDVKWRTEEGRLAEDENSLEDAYDMGYSAAEHENYDRGYERGYAAGILVAAKTVYGGKR